MTSKSDKHSKQNKILNVENGCGADCCCGLCTSDNRYPNKLPPGTCFLRFAKPGTVKGNMTEWGKRQQKSKTEIAKRWIHASCGRKHFTLKQITKYSYICSLHFIDPIEENPDPLIATLQLRGNAEKESRQVEQHRSRVQKVVIIFHGVVNMCT